MSEVTVAVGEAAPGFTLPDEHERQVSLPAPAATTVLVFYRGNW